MVVGLLMGATFSAMASMVEVKFPQKETPLFRKMNPKIPKNRGDAILKKVKQQEKQAYLHSKSEEIERKEKKLKQIEEQLKQQEEQLRRQCLYNDLISAVNEIDEPNVPEIISLLSDPVLKNCELARCIGDIYNGSVYGKQVTIKIEDTTLLFHVPFCNIQATAHKIHAYILKQEENKQKNTST
jgi:hypothetical protein